MVLKCCVCKLQSDDGYSVSFHKLPTREEPRKKWLDVLEAHCPPLTQKYLYVCSQHFERECFRYSGLCQRRMLKSESVPTIFNTDIARTEEQHSDEIIHPETEDTVEGNKNSSELGDENIEIYYVETSEQEVLDTTEDLPLRSLHATVDKAVDVGEHLSLRREQRLRAENARLRHRNKNLARQLGMYRRKMYRFKFLFERLRRKKFNANGNDTSL
ncbi:uncharacterized protein LOC105688906 [Athalia rosae]|uniref:uncharacterized protein LOC105688906 n=1 Tax=Athalia rosae TaxID=37344 RepID=UPI00203449B3|nr:uncharacterized protein LOC105688906 [Athalia rosae]